MSSLEKPQSIHKTNLKLTVIFSVIMAFGIPFWLFMLIVLMNGFSEENARSVLIGQVLIFVMSFVFRNLMTIPQLISKIAKNNGKMTLASFLLAIANFLAIYTLAILLVIPLLLYFS
ncbi:hypothetical protein N9D31_03205 [Oligoflexaceae bacterium]|nr:hypothetical protein [Oligoflexaceae bacterium]